MSEKEHIHTPSRDSNTCKECGELIHTFKQNGEKDESTVSFDPKSLNKVATKLDGAANKIGVALVLFVVGIFVFPFGIVLWLFALGIILSIFSSNDK